jgi:tetratricopeptide (TPR) repeat protein
MFHIWHDEAQSDTNRLGALHQVIWSLYLYRRPDSAFQLAQLMYDFAEDKGLKKQMGDALNVQGASLQLSGNYSKALNYFEACLDVQREIDNPGGICTALNNMGLISKINGNLSQALAYYQESAEKLKIMKDSARLATVWSQMGIIYEAQDDPSKAMTHYQYSLDVQPQTGGERTTSIVLNNMGNIYRDQGNYPQALAYHEKSMAIKRDAGFQQGVANSLNNIGRVHLLKGAYQQAIDNCTEGFQLASELDAIVIQKEACQCLHDIYQATNDQKNVLAYLEKIKVLDDQLAKKETTKKLLEKELKIQMMKDSIRHEEEKINIETAYQKEVAQQKIMRQLLMIGGVLILFLVVGLLARNYFVPKV